ncbi:MAG: CHAD domain-containing protein [Desulfuromonadaceae bacterium]|nr:CHAD domain-containing protein [Desulfuromonadaceae bacterium]
MPPATTIERSQDTVLTQWQELLRLRRKVLNTSDLEAIHDLRVTSRRLRAAVGLFELWILQKNAAVLKKNCRKLTRVLGGLRNIDEALLFFRLHTPAESGGGYQICRILSEQRPRELKRIKKALTKLDHRRLNRMMQKAVTGLKEKLPTDSGSPSLPDYFSDMSLRLFQPIQNLLPVATSPNMRESRHALRIAIKKWRYFLEIVAPVLECDCSSTLDQLKEYQTTLGRMNDIVEFRALCGSLPLSRHERTFIETTLHTEDKLLLQKLTTLIRQKPLTYTCLS